VFEANIKNVAVEKHFYTQPANTSVDDEITELERLCAIARSIRALPSCSAALDCRSDINDPAKQER